MSGTITHSWNGTVLTVTSDSGTSSADLKGAKGDTGIRGPQGAQGVVDTSKVYTTSNPPTAAEVGARDKEWLPTLAELGAAPAGYINFAGAVNTYAEFEALIDSTFNSIGDNKEYRLFCAISSSSGAVPAGSWFVSIKREWADYGVVEIVNDSYRMERKKFGTWKEWVNTSASAFAPANKTLVFANSHINGNANFNDITTIGIYWVNTWVSSGGNNLPNGKDTGFLIVYAYPNSNSLVIQEYHSYKNPCCVVKRSYKSDGGIWSEWEWENPPMELGVEYRTTERLNGKSVYTQAFNAGALVNGSYVSYPVNNLKYIIRGNAMLSSGTCLPFDSHNSSSPHFATVYFAQYEMWMHCGSSQSGQTVLAQIWYTKENVA